MPGFLVDDQSLAIDAAIASAYPSPSSIIPSCGNDSPPYHALQPPFSHPPSPLATFSPHLSRSYSANNSRSTEFSQRRSQLSPRLYQRSSSFVTNGQPCNLLGSTHHVSSNDNLEAEFAAYGEQEFQLDASIQDSVRNAQYFRSNVHAKDFFATYPDNPLPSFDPLVGNGSDTEEQIAPGSPFSLGASLWSPSSTWNSLVASPTRSDAILAFHRFLPSNSEDEQTLPAKDVYSCDDFRMYEFKVRRCMRGGSHDWTECPFAHPGEKARRRDPRRFHYSGTACLDFRKGNCKRGDACDYAHGVFECWLHPARYRTQPCKDGRNCKRRVCFFAHTLEQLRLLPEADGRAGGHSTAFKSSFIQMPHCDLYDGSPFRSALAASLDATIPAMEQGASGFSGSPRGKNESYHTSNIDFLPACCTGSQSETGHHGEDSQDSSPLSTSAIHFPDIVSPGISCPSSPLHSTHLGSGSSVDGSNDSLGKSLSPFAPSANPNSIPQHSSFGNSSLTKATPFQLQSSVGVVAHTSHNQSCIAAHRRHLDRLNSMPTISIPTTDLNSSFSSPPSPAGLHDARQISDLSSSLKQLAVSESEPVWQAGQVVNMVRTRYLLGRSPLGGNSLSVPSTPTKSWQSGESHFWRFGDGDRETLTERVESGRRLRAKIFQSLVKRDEEIDPPDVGWVNELVKEDGDGK